MCLDLKCIDHIKKIIENPATKELVVTEGKLTINNILACKTEIPPEEDLNLKKIDSLVTKEIKNFLIGGKICRMYIFYIYFFNNLIIFFIKGIKKMEVARKCTYL